MWRRHRTMPVGQPTGDAMQGQPRIWVYNLLFVLAAFLLLTIRMLPQVPVVRPLHQPDLLFCLMAAWLVRRPEYLSPAVIVVSVLVTEILFLQPPGLWAALVLLTSEFFRSTADRVRFLPFGYEWLIAATAYAVAILAYSLLLALTLVPGPDARTIALQLFATAAAYPLVVAATNLVFRIRKSSSIRTGLLEEGS